MTGEKDHRRFGPYCVFDVLSPNHFNSAWHPGVFRDVEIVKVRHFPDQTTEVFPHFTDDIVDLT